MSMFLQEAIAQMTSLITDLDHNPNHTPLVLVAPGAPLPRIVRVAEKSAVTESVDLAINSLTTIVNTGGTQAFIDLCQSFEMALQLIKDIWGNRKLNLPSDAQPSEFVSMQLTALLNNRGIGVADPRFMVYTNLVFAVGRHQGWIRDADRVYVHYLAPMPVWPDLLDIKADLSRVEMIGALASITPVNTKEGFVRSEELAANLASFLSAFATNLLSIESSWHFFNIGMGRLRQQTTGREFSTIVETDPDHQRLAQHLNLRLLSWCEDTDFVYTGQGDHSYWKQAVATLSDRYFNSSHRLYQSMPIERVKAWYRIRRATHTVTKRLTHFSVTKSYKTVAQYGQAVQVMDLPITGYHMVKPNADVTEKVRGLLSTFTGIYTLEKPLEYVDKVAQSTEDVREHGYVDINGMEATMLALAYCQSYKVRLANTADLSSDIELEYRYDLAEGLDPRYSRVGPAGTFAATIQDAGTVRATAQPMDVLRYAKYTPTTPAAYPVAERRFTDLMPNTAGGRPPAVSLRELQVVDLERGHPIQFPRLDETGAEHMMSVHSFTLKEAAILPTNQVQLIYLTDLALAEAADQAIRANLHALLVSREYGPRAAEFDIHLAAAIVAATKSIHSPIAKGMFTLLRRAGIPSLGNEVWDQQTAAHAQLSLINYAHSALLGANSRHLSFLHDNSELHHYGSILELAQAALASL